MPRIKSPRLNRINCLVVLFWLFLVNSLNAVALESITLRKIDKNALSLKNAEFLALTNNPNLGMSQESYKYALMAIREAKLKRLPTFSAFSNYNYSNNPIFVFSALLMQQRFSTSNFAIHNLNNPNPINNFLSAVYTQVPIFTGFQLETAIAIAKLNKDKKNYEQKIIEQETRLKLISTFYGVILSKLKVELTDNSINSAKARLKKIRDLNSTGMVTNADVLNGELELAKIRQLKIIQTGDLAIARAKLASVLGDLSFVDIPVLGQIAKPEFKLLAQEEYFKLAILNRPDYKMSNTDIAISSQNVKNAYGKFLPKANFYAAGINSGNAVVNGGSSFLLGANLSIKVFDATLFTNERKAKIAKQIAYQQYKQKKLDIYVEVVKAYNELIANQEKASVELESINKAKAALKIIQDRYNVGLAGISDLMSAQNAELSTKTDYLAALYESKVSYANLLFTCGILNDTTMF